MDLLLRRFLIARCGAALLLLLGGFATAAVAAAAEAPSSPPEETPRFLVERIVVEGLERAAAREIVLSESLLRGGRSYTEPELREAVYRVKRLPFVVDADLALRKGSARGAYELAIVVEAAKPLAFSTDVAAIRVADDFGIDEGVSWGASGTLAARKFVGARGLLFGSVQGFDESAFGQTVQVGYTRYGLFPTGGYATVAASSLVGGSYSDDNLQASLQLGIPIGGNHALRAGLAWTRSESESYLFVANPDDPANPFTPVGPADRRADARNVELEWIFDSTDDPLLPTRGLRVSTAAQVVTDEVTERSRQPRLTLESESEVQQLRAEARRHWPVTPQQSLALRLAAWRTENEFDDAGSRRQSDVENLLFLEATHALDMWDFGKRRRVGDLRWENGVVVDRFHESIHLAFGRETTDETRFSFRSSLLFRNDWGLVRLSFLYFDSLEGG